MASKPQPESSAHVHMERLRPSASHAWGMVLSDGSDGRTEVKSSLEANLRLRGGNALTLRANRCFQGRPLASIAIVLPNTRDTR